MGHNPGKLIHSARKSNLIFYYMTNLTHYMLHMEVLMAYVGERHSALLAIERSTFSTPWLINHILAKQRAFKAVKNKKLVRWGESIRSVSQDLVENGLKMWTLFTSP